MPEEVLFCWSGGKDSAMALHTLQSAGESRVTALLTTVTEEYDRIQHARRAPRAAREAGRVNRPAAPRGLDPTAMR